MSELRRTHFIYNVHQLDNGNYVFLNRDYKPIGFDTSKHLIYEDYPIGMKLRILPIMAAKISCRGEKNTKDIWLYNDGSIPTKSAKNMKAYLTRLAFLMKLKAK